MDKIPAIEEWTAVSIDCGRIRLSIGDEMTAENEDDYFVTLTPENAMALALSLLEKAYTAKGEEVERILIMVNPELDEEPAEEPKPEDLPS